MTSQESGNRGRWSLMEWIFGGSLPKRARTTPPPAIPSGDGDSPAPPAAKADSPDAARGVTDPRRRGADPREELERVRQASAQVHQDLAAQEARLQQRQPELKRDLAPAEEPPPPAVSFAERLRQGVAKTRDKLGSGLSRITLGRKELGRDVLEDLEEVLLTADVGPQTTQRLIKAVEDQLRRNELKDPARLKAVLKTEVERVMSRTYPTPNLEGKPPVVILFAGINGSGKTTTIGKLAAQYHQEGKKVLLAAGDTFRAAAAEQLAGWGQRSGCDIFRREAGANPSGVIYQAVEQGLKEGYDLVLCDTAGRLHTKTNLMEELKKIKRVMAKLVPDAPQETYLVLDANNGQNAIHQVRDFHTAIGVTGLIITKLDGTARGGVIVGIVNEFDLPVRYIGVGEGVDDLRPFDPVAYTDSLFE